MATYTSYLGWGRRAWDEGAWNYDFDEMIIDGSGMTVSRGTLTATGAAATTVTGIAIQTFSGTINATADLTTSLTGFSLSSSINSMDVLTWLAGNGGGNYSDVSGNPTTWSPATTSNSSNYSTFAFPDMAEYAYWDDGLWIAWDDVNDRLAFDGVLTLSDIYTPITNQNLVNWSDAT